MQVWNNNCASSTVVLSHWMVNTIKNNNIHNYAVDNFVDNYGTDKQVDTVSNNNNHYYAWCISKAQWEFESEQYQWTNLSPCRMSINKTGYSWRQTLPKTPRTSSFAFLARERTAFPAKNWLHSWNRKLFWKLKLKENYIIHQELIIILDWNYKYILKSKILYKLVKMKTDMQ